LSRCWLLDVNVLLGLMWPVHEANRASQTWVSNHRGEPWASCPITEMGFLRIVTNRSFSRNAPTWAEATSLLRRHVELNAGHEFWPDSVTLAEVDDLLGDRIKGPSQITDAYLLALAVRHQGSFVTFDYRTHTLAPAGSPEHDALVILHP